jgi:hypothetical protein
MDPAPERTPGSRADRAVATIEQELRVVSGEPVLRLAGKMLVIRVA